MKDRNRFGVAAFVVAFLLSALLASSSFAGTLVVLNKSGASASLIDDATGEIIATVPTGNAPHEVAVSPDGRLAVGTNYGNREAPGSTLTVIDIPGAKVVKTIDLGEYRRPHGVQWLSDGRHVVVTAEGNKALLKVDVEAGEVVSAVETGQEVSHMVAVTPDGKRAFVANIGSGSVTAIDLDNGKKLGDIVTGEGAEGIAVTPDGRHVWVTNRGADTICVIDASTLKVVATLESKTFPIRAKVTPDGRYVLVSNARSGDLAVFDAKTHKELRRISFKTQATTTEGRLFGDQFGESSVPIGIVIRPDGKRAYVAHTNADQVSVVDLESWEVAEKWTPGKEPDGMDYSKLTVKK
jgi:YVTN family beta-propeller protein